MCGKAFSPPPSFYPVLFLDNVFVAVVEHSKANMQWMWQKITSQLLHMRDV